MWLYVINKVKVTYQGEGHIKVKVKYLHPFKFYVAHALYKRVVCIRLKYYLFFFAFFQYFFGHFSSIFWAFFQYFLNVLFFF